MVVSVLGMAGLALLGFGLLTSGLGTDLGSAFEPAPISAEEEKAIHDCRTAVAVTDGGPAWMNADGEAEPYTGGWRLELTKDGEQTRWSCTFRADGMLQDVFRM